MRALFRFAFVLIVVAGGVLWVKFAPQGAGPQQKWLDTLRLHERQLNAEGAMVLLAKLASLGVLLLMFALLRGRRLLAKWGQHRHLRALVLQQLCHDVIDTDGDLENDGAVYPSSRSINVLLQLAHRRSNDGRMVSVSMHLRRPDGQRVLVMEQQTTALPGENYKLIFQLLDLSELRNATGEWRAEFWIGKTLPLGVLSLHIVDTQAMVKDLEVAEFCLTTGDGTSLPAGQEVLSPLPSLRPVATLRLAKLNPRRASALKVQFILSHKGESSIERRIERPVVFSNGICPIANVHFDTSRLPTGRWECRLCCGSRVLQMMWVTLVSAAQVLASVRVEALNLVGMTPSGREVLLTGRASAGRLHSIVPVLRLINPFPMPIGQYRLTVVVESEAGVAAFVDHAITLDFARTEIMPGELVIDQTQLGESCCFYIMLEDRCLASRKLSLIDPPQVTDVEGRLTVQEFDDDAATVNARADQLLQAVNVG